MKDLKDMDVEERAKFKYNAEKLYGWGTPVMMLGVILLIIMLGLWLVMTMDGFPGAFMMVIPMIFSFVLIGIGWLTKLKGGEQLSQYEAFEKSQQNIRAQPQYQQPYQQTAPAQYQQQPPPPTTPTQGKFCPYCGTNNPVDYNYCSQCQKPLP